MKYKIGQELYTYYVGTEDETSGKLSLHTHIVRTIRGGKVYAILKESYTWGKRSKKHGDYGWLDPLPAWCRTWVRVGCKFSWLFTTKRQALLDLRQEISENEYFTKDHKKRVLSNIKRQLTRIKKGKK